MIAQSRGTFGHSWIVNCRNEKSFASQRSGKIQRRLYVANALRTGDFAKMPFQRTRTKRLQVFCGEICHHQQLNCVVNRLRITK